MSSLHILFPDNPARRGLNRQSAPVATKNDDATCLAFMGRSPHARRASSLLVGRPQPPSSYWGNIGIMEKKMETTILGLYRVYIGVIFLGLFRFRFLGLATCI